MLPLIVSTRARGRYRLKIPVSGRSEQGMGHEYDAIQGLYGADWFR
ncbi:hypothetical protein DO64_5491 [Burkholderia pseudomallei]|nr:hypothetical protein DO64_5491 [Burkholderia pseudomallei]